MANQNDIQIGLSINTQQASINTAKKALQDVKQAQMDLNTAFAKGSTEASDFASDLGKAVKQEKQLEVAAKDATSALRQQQAAALDLANTRFDQVSQQVGLAGDVESALLTVGGAASTLGAGGLGGAIGAGAEIFAVVEALPRLKEAAGALPNVVSAAAAAIGTSSTGLIAGLGLAAVAVVAFNFVLQDLQEKSAAAVDAVTEGINNLRRAEQLFAGGATTEDVQTEIARINQQRTAELEVIRIATESLETLVAASNGIETDAIKALRKELEAANTNILSFDQQIRQLERGLSEGKTSAADAAAAALALAEAQAKQSTAQTQSAVTARDNASAQNEQAEAQRQAEARARELEARRAEARRQAEQAQQEAERKRQQRAEEQKRELERLAKATQDYENALRNSRLGLQDAITDISTELGDNLREAIIGTQQTIEDAVADTNAIAVVEAEKELRRERQRLERQSADAQRDARIDFERQIRDAQLRLQEEYGTRAIELERQIAAARLSAQAGGMSGTAALSTGTGRTATLRIGMNWEDAFRTRYEGLQRLIDANNANIMRQVTTVLGG